MAIAPVKETLGKWKSCQRGRFSVDSKELEYFLNSRCLILTAAPGFDRNVGSFRKGGELLPPGKGSAPNPQVCPAGMHPGISLLNLSLRLEASQPPPLSCVSDQWELQNYPFLVPCPSSPSPDALSKHTARSGTGSLPSAGLNFPAIPIGCSVPH